MLGTDELDAQSVQFGRCLLEEPLGRLDVELEASGRTAVGERGEHVDGRCDRRRELADHRFEDGKVAGIGGHLDGERVAGPDVVGGAPATGIDLVDELELDLPVVVTVVGHDETQAADQDRFAAGALAGAAEVLLDGAEGVDVGDPRQLHTGVLAGEAAEHGAGDGGAGRAVGRHRRLPRRLVQPGARGGVDEPGEDRRRPHRRRAESSRRGWSGTQIGGIDSARPESASPMVESTIGIQWTSATRPNAVSCSRVVIAGTTARGLDHPRRQFSEDCEPAHRVAGGGRTAQPGEAGDGVEAHRRRPQSDRPPW